MKLPTGQAVKCFAKFQKDFLVPADDGPVGGRK
jgi:hypothetical protein